MLLSLSGCGEVWGAICSGGDRVLLYVIHLGQIYKNEGKPMSWIA